MNSTLRRCAVFSTVAVLGLTACSDDGEKAPFSSSQGGASGSASASASTAPSSSGSASAAPSGTSPASAGTTPSAGASAGPTATPLRSAGSDPALSGGPTALPARRTYGPPAAGRYTYANTGSIETSVCAVDRRPYPATTDLQISALRGARQEGVRGDAEQGTQSSVIEYRDSGLYLVSLVLDQPGLGRIEFRPAAPVLFLPAPPTVGKTWTFTLRSTDGKYTLDSTSRITALKQPVRLGDGSTVSTTTVRTVSTLTGTSSVGAVDLTLTTVSSASHDPALAVKEVQDTEGTVGPCRVDGHVESVMRSTRPA